MTYHEMQVEAKSRMITLAEKANQPSSLIDNMTYELLLLHSQADVQETDDIIMQGGSHGRRKHPN
jgi:hypothetical protein